MFSSIRSIRSFDLWCAALVIAITTIVFFLSKNRYGSPAVYVGDANYYYAYLPSLVFDHDLDLTNQYVATHNWYGFGITSQGVPGNVFGIGPAIFALPFFLVGMLLSKFAGIAPTGFGVHEITATLFASAFFTALAVWPAALLIRRHFGGRITPWIVAAAGVLGTPIAYYAIRQPGYAHPFATFWVATFLNHWDAGRAQDTSSPKRWRWWLMAGALMGAAALARPQCASWGVLLLWSAWQDIRAGLHWRRLVTHALVSVVAAFVVFSPQLYVWKAIYGHWFFVPQGVEFMRWDDPSLSAVLFSSRNGLFAFTPLTALCVLGLFMVGRKHLVIATALAFGFALQVFTNGAVWDWWAGGSFGGRRFDSCYITFCFGLAGFVYFPFRVIPKLLAPLSKLRIVASPKILHWFGVAGSAVLAAWCFMIVAGNIALTSKISPPNLVSAGGTPLYTELRRLVDSPWKSMVVGLSKNVTAPARWLFARKYGAQPLAYDWVVGKHFLGESYPGVNSRIPERAQNIPLKSSQLFIVGLAPGLDHVEPKNNFLRFLLPINRKHGPMVVRVDLDRPLSIADANVKWNGLTMDAAPIGNSLQFVTPTFRRGTNMLDVRVETKVHFLSLALAVPENELP